MTIIYFNALPALTMVYGISRTDTCTYSFEPDNQSSSTLPGYRSQFILIYLLDSHAFDYAIEPENKTGVAGAGVKASTGIHSITLSVQHIIVSSILKFG